jgi:hypothetical protein
MRVMSFVLVALATSVIACSGTPTLSIPMDLNWSGDFEAQVFDHTGLVTGGRQLPFSEWHSEGATADPEHSEIDVTWTGGACSHHPTVTLSGSKDALSIRVTNPSDSIFPVACPAVGLLAGITLELSEPVSGEALRFETAPL